MPRRVLEADGWKYAERFWLEGNSWTPFDGQSYHTEVLKDAPVAYWRLGEAAGATTAVDETGNGHDGTYNGPTLEAVGAIERGSDFAASFDGTDDYVDMGSPSALNITGDLTLEMWVKSPSSADNRVIITWVNGNHTAWPYHLVLQSDGTLKLNRDDTSAASNGTVDDGNWHHVVITDDTANDEVRFYIDGALDTSAAYASAAGSGDDFLTLSRSDNSPFGDVMDEAAVYDKVLTETQVTEHYRLAFSRYAQTILEDQPVAYWRLGESAGATTAKDVTGNHHDGTYNGPTLEATGAIPRDTDTAASFDGTDDYTDHTTIGSFGASSTQTIEWWIRTTTTAATNVYGTFNDNSTTGIQTILNQDSTDSLVTDAIKVFWRFEDGGGSNGAVDSPTVSWRDGGWHHIVVSCDAPNTTIRVWIDGEEQTFTYTDQGVPSTYADFQYPLVWGARNNRGTIDEFSDIDLDEIAMYDFLLSPQRVTEHYKTGVS